MWILVRIAIAFLGFIVRHLWFKRSSHNLSQRNGFAFFTKTLQSKRRIRGYEMGVECKTPLFVLLTPENKTDRFFKSFGFSSEYQTGDAEFDSNIYIACDNPHFNYLLKSNEQLRNSIKVLMQSGYRRIWTNGSFIYAKSKNAAPTEVLIDHLASFARALTQENFKAHSYGRDPFFWKVLIIESIVWSLLFYAIPSFFTFTAVKEDYHLSIMKILTLASICGAVIVAGLLAIVIFWINRSSRSHKIIMESGVLLLIALPLIGTQIASDINIGMDSSESIFVEANVVASRSQLHRRRSRRGASRSYYTYHMQIAVPPGSRIEQNEFKYEIQISQTVFQQAQPGKKIVLEIGEGYLGARWFKKIDQIPVAL